MTCCKPRHTDLERKSRHKHYTNHHSNDQAKTCMRSMNGQHNHSNNIRKHCHESHHRKTHDSERSVVKHKQHGSRSADRHGKESSQHAAEHKACRCHPKQTIDSSSSTSEGMNKLQVNVEVEVDSGSSTCEVLKTVDIEGTLAVNTTVIQPALRSKNAKDSSHGGIRSNKHNERKCKTAADMREIDVCIDSGLTVVYKKNDISTGSRCVTAHKNKYDRNKSSKEVMKNCSILPVISADKSLELNSELQFSFELVKNNSSELSNTIECCKSIRDEITFKENGDLLKTIENKCGKLYFKMDRHKCNCNNTMPNIVQGYEKTFIVKKTKCNCAGNCHKCNSSVQNGTSDKKLLLQKNHSSEPVVRKRSLLYYDKGCKSENDTCLMNDNLSANVSDDWNRGETTTYRDVDTLDSDSSGWVRRESMSERENGVEDSSTSDWDRKGSMSEREAGKIDSASSSWDKEESVPVDQDLSEADRVSNDWARESLPDLEDGLNDSDSKSFDHDEKNFDPSLEDLNKKESVSDQVVGEKHSSSTFWDIQDDTSDRHITENGWDTEERIPEEEGISTVDPLPLEYEDAVPDYLNSQESIHGGRDYGPDDPTMDDQNTKYYNQDKPDIGEGEHILDDRNNDESIQAERNNGNDDPLLTTSTEDEIARAGARINIVDSVVDYLKKGILLSSEDENVYRRRHLFSSRIGRDVLNNVGGIEATGISNEYKDKDSQVSINNDREYEVLNRTDSFRSTLDETATMMSRPQVDRYWTFGPTATYLGDRISYFHMPTNNNGMGGSVPSSSESMRTGNHMLDEVSAILKQIDLPYISHVGSNIRNQSDIGIVPSRSQSEEYGSTQVKNMFSFENFGIKFTNSQPVAVSENTFNYKDKLFGIPKEVKKTSFLQNAFSAIGSLRHILPFIRTSADDKTKETFLSSPRGYETDETVQIPKIKYSDVKFLATRENLRHDVNYGNEPIPYGQSESDELMHAEDNDSFLNDGSHSFSKTNVPLALKKHVDSSTERNKNVNTKDLNLDTEAKRKPGTYKHNDIKANSKEAMLNTKHYDRKSNSFINMSNYTFDDDSQSSSSEEVMSVAGTEDTDEQLDASTKEDRIPFQGIRGYPTRLYPITLYCLFVLFLYLFWTTCYFNCTHIKYGIAMKSNKWYCRIYRAVKDSNNYTPEIPKRGNDKFFHPFRPW